MRLTGTGPTDVNVNEIQMVSHDQLHRRLVEEKNLQRLGLKCLKKKDKLKGKSYLPPQKKTNMKHESITGFFNRKIESEPNLHGV